MNVEGLHYSGGSQVFDCYTDYEFDQKIDGVERLYVITYDSEVREWYGIMRVALHPEDDFSDGERMVYADVMTCVKNIPADVLPHEFLVDEYVRYRSQRGLFDLLQAVCNSC